MLLSRGALRAAAPAGRPRACGPRHVAAVRAPTAARYVATRYKQGPAPLADQVQRLPYDCTELLDLHGRESFLLCDITKAYDTLRCMPLVEGYSDAVVQGRAEVLGYIKDVALDNEGQVQPDRAIDLPVSLLPSALALLAQLNQNLTVYELAERMLQDKEVSAAYGRDLVLSLVVAHCNIARDLLTEQKVAEGCCVLEEGLARLQAVGRPPLAPGLAADIQQAVETLLVHRLRDQFRTGGAFEPSERSRAVRLLRSLLAPGAAGKGGKGLLGGPAPAGGSVSEAALRAVSRDVTPDMIREVVQHLDSAEVTAMADWEQVARRAGSAVWLCPGMLQTAAAAHLATAVTQQRVADAHTALALAKAAPASCESLLLRGVAHMLLGDPPAAAAAIKAAASAPRDKDYQLPAGGVSLRALQDSEVAEVLLLPPGSQAYDFVAAHSHAEDEPPLLTGLFVYADTFLQQAVLPGFPDTAEHYGGSALAAYLDAPGVQAQLLAAKEAGAGLARNLSAVKDAVLSMQPLMQQFAASASSTLGSLQARGSQLAAETGQSGAAERLRGGAAAAAATLDEFTLGLQKRLGVRLPVAAAAGAALAAALLAAALSRAGGRANSAAVRRQHQPLATTLQHASSGEALSAGAAAAASRPMTRASAASLLKRFQGAKAAALGSNFDTSQLPGVCCGAALSRFEGMAGDWASKGWFRTATVWKNDVTRVAPLTSTGLRVLVTARVGERAETWGIDGQRGSAWSNEYDVDYEVVLCRDLQWRIERVTVRGSEPGMPGLFGTGWLGGMFGGGSSSK